MGNPIKGLTLKNAFQTFLNVSMYKNNRYGIKSLIFCIRQLYVISMPYKLSYILYFGRSVACIITLYPRSINYI